MLLLSTSKKWTFVSVQVMGASEVNEGAEQQEGDDDDMEADFMGGMFAE